MHIRDFIDKLSPLAAKVCIEGGTEPPFSGKYVHPGNEGVYLCVGCGTTLFYAQDQYDSKSGWPSFTQPFEPDVVDYYQDESGAEPRTEVRCACCQSHLGHVFDDGPEPERLRYCINSVALVLEEDAVHDS
ncbi:MAG: peptide-methionine (R)-S-oxide reductase [Legionellales bacterium]|nr:peptide-methionine (R)-S-oxide reductase [Legionellales bacterium]